MTINLKNKSGGDKFQTELCGTDPTVGTDYLALIDYDTAAEINAGIDSVGDIDSIDDADWTDLFEITGDDFYEVYIDGGSNARAVSLSAYSGETVGNALRFQIIADDVVIFDIKVVADGTTNQINRLHAPSSYVPVYFKAKNSVLIRVAREGTFDSISEFVLNAVIANTLEVQ